jgi:hypothetical protein
MAGAQRESHTTFGRLVTKRREHLANHLLRLPAVGDNSEMSMPFQFSIRTMLAVVTVFCATVRLITIGTSVEAIEVVAWMIILCGYSLVIVRSAHRDACRRQRWPGKNRKTGE